MVCLSFTLMLHKRLTTTTTTIIWMVVIDSCVSSNFVRMSLIGGVFDTGTIAAAEAEEERHA